MERGAVSYAMRSVARRTYALGCQIQLVDEEGVAVGTIALVEDAQPAPTLLVALVSGTGGLRRPACCRSVWAR
jgi:hypothetical protein